jgi:hypothetical protein
MRREERGSLYLLTGLLVGLALGLGYSWWIRPVTYAETTPASLRADFKDQYRSMIAVAYLANGDLLRARGRLDLLQDPDMYQALAEQAQRTLAQGTSGEEARALGLLAVAVGQQPQTGSSPQGLDGPEAASPSPTPPALTPDLTFTALAATLLPSATGGPPSGETPVGISPTATPVLAGAPVETPTFTPGPTDTPAPVIVFTPPPTRTPTATQGAPFALQSRDLVCNPALDEPLIQVQAQDAAGQPVPGLEFVVSWPGGEERFFTGLKPDLGLGYGDFTMVEGVTYALQLAEGGEPIVDLTPQECETGSGRQYLGSWLLTFVRP